MVGPNRPAEIVGGRKECRAITFEITCEGLDQCLRRVETRNLTRTIELVANVMMPDHLAIR